MRLQGVSSTGDSVRAVDQVPAAIEPGTLMHKAIPPRMVEPYLTGRRSIISGFVHRVAESAFSSPREFHSALNLDYEGSEFTADMPEIYVLRWRAVSTDAYRVATSADRGGDWSMKPPFTGDGFTASRAYRVAEYYLDPVPVPVGAEMHRVAIDGTDFIARYDGQVWLRPAEGSELCATG